MGVPPLPHDPHDPFQTQPPAPQQPYPGPMPPPPPQPQIVYVQVPEQAGGRRQRKQVSRGKVGASGHSVHLILTVCTCGAWAPVWFLHWLFTRSKTVTRG
jgi:hypothetical protein